eukprot:g1810.t1
MTEQSGESSQFYSKNGWCKSSDHSKYEHVLAESQDEPPEKGEREVCRFFSKAGWCKYGDGCVHHHISGDTLAARRESFQASTSYGAIQITPPRTARGLVVPYVQPTRQAPMPTPPMPPPVPGAHAPKAPTSRLSAAEAEARFRPADVLCAEAWDEQAGGPLRLCVYQMWRLLCWPLLSVAVVVRPPFSQGSLHEQMHTMMSDSEEAPWKDRLISETDDADDPYMKEAAEGLSKALGPRWDQKALEVDANRKTRALLKGISGSSGMQSLQKMLGALR